MRPLALVMSLALAATACSDTSDGSAEPLESLSTTTTVTVTTTTTVTRTPTTTTIATTTSTVDEAEQSIADREAELIELIAADATGPDEWVQVAARALAAEQLILERPGEVDLLNYFTEDSPYLEETIRPAVAEFKEEGWVLDGLLVRLKGVSVQAQLGDRTMLDLDLLDVEHVVRTAEGEVLFERAPGGALRVQVVVATEADRIRVHDRTRVT